MYPTPGAPPKLRILVTAFGAFPGAPSNPTLSIIARLGKSRRAALFDVEIVTRALPVVYAGALIRLARLIGDIQPDAIVHLGLAGRRKAMSVESRALNRLGPLRQDAARQTPESNRIRPGGRDALKARWPAVRLATVLKGAGAGAQLSIDAGDYVCNQTLYLSLELSGVPTGFIHIPRPRPRRPEWRMGAAAHLPTLAQMTGAVEAAALAMAAHARRTSRLRAQCGSNIVHGS